jgi:hypothetical protein
MDPKMFHNVLEGANIKYYLAKVSKNTPPFKDLDSRVKANLHTPDA